MAWVFLDDKGRELEERVAHKEVEEKRRERTTMKTKFEAMESSMEEGMDIEGFFKVHRFTVGD